MGTREVFDEACEALAVIRDWLVVARMSRVAISEALVEARVVWAAIREAFVEARSVLVALSD